MRIRPLHPPSPTIAALLMAGVLFGALGVAAPAAAQMGDPYGKQTYPESRALAERLAGSEPATAWETALDGEAADLLEFIGDDLLLVGVVEVNRNAAPEHGRLHLFDLASGRQRWRTDRPDMGTGGYELLATEPWLLLKGSDGDDGILTALDVDSGDREWEVRFDEPSSLMFAPGGEALLVLEHDDGRARLRGIRPTDGDELWSVAVPEALVAEGAPPSLVAQGFDVLLAGRGLARVDASSGTLGAALEVPELAGGEGSTLASEAGVWVWDARSVSLIDASARSVRWGWHAEARIRTVSPVDGGVLVMAGPEEAPTLTLLEEAGGSERWSWQAGSLLTGPVAANDDLLLIPLDAELVGLDAASGSVRFRTPLPEDVAAGSPSHAEFVGMPDVLRTEDGVLYLARERAGLLAFGLPGGQLSWFRPHHETPSTLGRYSGEGRFAYVFEAQLMQAGGVPEDLQRPAKLGIGSGSSSSSLFAAAQRDYEAARSRYDALGSGASRGEQAGAVADVRTASELGIAAAQLDAAMGQMEAGAELARSILSFRDVIRAYNVASGLQGLVDRAQLSMRSTLLMQQRLFQSGLYVRPYVMANTGRGVSLVRLDSGLRSDPVFSPVNAPSAAYGLDLGVMRVSPTGKRLAMVGISLDTDGWERRGKWNTHVPEMSLVTYRVDDLEFGEEPRYPYILSDLIVLGDVVAVRRALEAGADPNAIGGSSVDPPLHLAAGLMRPEIVRLLLDAGADPNGIDGAGNKPIQLTLDPAIKELLLAAGAEEPEVGGANIQTVTSPLFIAVSAQNPDMARRAIADGADPNLRVGHGQSILYLAVALDNPDMVRLLLELGATTDWEDVNGDSPMDLAQSDAVREALRGG